MDKNVTKNIAIIMLVIFLAFSVVLNVFFIMKSQALQQDNNFLFSGRIHRNQTLTDLQTNPFSNSFNSSAEGIIMPAPPLPVT